MSILFALAAAIGWGSSDFAAGHASRRSSAVSVVILTHCAAFFALLAISFIPGQGGSPGVGDIGWGVAAGLSGGLGAMLLFRGLSKGSMAVVAPITATGAATIPVVAGLLQGESISPLGVLGVGIALASIVLVSLAADDTDTDAVGNTGDFNDDETNGSIDRSSRHVGGGQVVDRAALSPPALAHSWLPPRGLPVSTQPPRPLFRVPPPPPPQLSTPLPPPPPRFASPIPPPPPPRFSTPLPPPPPSPSPSPSPEASMGALLVREVDRQAVPDVAVDAARAPSPRGAAALIARPGVLDALLSGLGFGLFFVFIARTSESAGHWPLVAGHFVSVLMFAIGAVLTSGALLPERGSRRIVVLAGLLDAAAAVFFVLSTRNGLLSVGAVLSSLYPVVTIVLARFISQERIARRQVVGLILAGLAVSLLAI
jgi:drug/metabolite transporter (DMT)-like permease